MAATTIIIIMTLIGGIGSPLSFAQVQVGTTTAVGGTGDVSQRKLFTATTGEQWALFFNGTALEYVSSSDGVVWGSRGTLPYATGDFSLCFKSISGTDYLFIAIQTGFDVVVRRGVVSTGAITFDSEVVVLDGTSSTNWYQAPSVALSANNHLWVSGILVGDSRVAKDCKQVVVRRSMNTAGGTITGWQAASFLGKADAGIRSVVMLPRAADEMYVLANGVSDNIVGFLFDGTSWSEGNQGGDYS